MDPRHDEEIREEYASGPWLGAIRTKDSVTYYPRNRSRLPRFERTLPSGDVLVHDVHAGLVLRTAYHRAADLPALAPLGPELNDKQIMRLQGSNSEWFVFTYQEEYDENDSRSLSRLRVIERHCGRTRIDVLEVPSA